MPNRRISSALPSVAWAAVGLSMIVSGVAKGGEAPTTTGNRPQTPQSTARIEAAKALAGNDVELNRAWSFFCTPTDFNAPGPAMEAMKVFDNLYMLPSSTRQLTTVWAITTREGIILLDSGDQAQPDAILAGMQKVGLDPAQVKYILLGHGHGDHYAGALYFQERYGTRVGLSNLDWDVMYPASPPANAPAAQGTPVPKPKRDVVLEEGKPFVLGEQTVQVYSIPGHTPGSLGFIFNVTERGRTHTAAMFGGTILAQGGITTEGLNRYLASTMHFQEAAWKNKVDVEIQNHALFDSTPERAAKLKARKPGEPNPFLMTTDKYVKMWDISSACIRAELARR